jgi:hypothetical protein
LCVPLARPKQQHHNILKPLANRAALRSQDNLLMALYSYK